MTEHISHLYEFGPFRIDTTERPLLRDGKHVPHGKAYEMLLTLVERSGHIVGKQKIEVVAQKPGARPK